MNTKPYKPYGGKKRKWPLLLLCFFLFIALVLAGLETVIAVNSRTQVDDRVNTMVIFGCQVKPWGPSVLLQDRLDTALDYLEGHPDMKVVVTGGQGPDEPMSEAQCMEEYLRKNGFEGEIFLEDRSRNTWQNVTFTRALMENNGMDCMEDCHPLLVSNGFHLARIKMLWNRANPEGWPPSTLAAPTSHAPSAVQMFFREPLALVKSFVMDR